MAKRKEKTAFEKMREERTAKVQIFEKTAKRKWEICKANSLYAYARKLYKTIFKCKSIIILYERLGICK